MRIQETDRILKESRYSRQPVEHNHDEQGMVSRLWKSVSNLPHMITGIFRKSR